MSVYYDQANSTLIYGHHVWRRSLWPEICDGCPLKAHRCMLATPAVCLERFLQRTGNISLDCFHRHLAVTSSCGHTIRCIEVILIVRTMGQAVSCPPLTAGACPRGVYGGQSGTGTGCSTSVLPCLRYCTNVPY